MSATLEAEPKATTAVAVPNITPERAIELYIAVRDRKRDMEAAHKEALKPLDTALERLELTLLAQLDEAGVERVGSKLGTAYKITRTSATVSHWSETLAYIQEHEAWELLEARVNKTAALAIMEETKEPIPGVTVRREHTVNVRRAS